MVVSVKEQALMFLFSLLGGVGTGFLFDWFRLFFTSHKKKETWMGDAAFFLMAAFFLFWVSLRINDGAFRSYLWIGILFGFYIYRICFSRQVMRCSAFLLKITGKIFQFSLKIILFPIHLLMRILRKPIFAVIEPARILGKGIKRRYRLVKNERKRKREIAKKIWKKI